MGQGGGDLPDFPRGGGLWEAGVEVPAAGGAAVGDGVQSGVGEQAPGVDRVAGSSQGPVAVLGVEVQSQQRQTAGGVPQHDRSRPGGQRVGEGALGGGGVGGPAAAGDHDPHGGHAGDQRGAGLPFGSGVRCVVEIGQLGRVRNWARRNARRTMPKPGPGGYSGF